MSDTQVKLISLLAGLVNAAFFALAVAFLAEPSISFASRVLWIFNLLIHGPLMVINLRRAWRAS